MRQRRRIGGWRLGLLIPAVGIMVLASLPAASAWGSSQSVTEWIRQNAAPVNDTASLRRAVGDAQIVGLGESTHGAAEELTLKHSTVRVLVEQMGFRSIAWEEQWTTGLQVDHYIRTGTGDLDALMSRLGGQWQSREVAAVLVHRQELTPMLPI
jgi:erythromycin esterase